MALYISKNRIRPSFQPMTTENTPTALIKQPPPPKSTQKSFFDKKEVSLATNQNTVQLPSIIISQIDWLMKNNYCILPERTSIANGSKIENLALVVGYSGSDPRRYAANHQALSRLKHANPAPKLFIFVEVLNPGETSFYQYLSATWDKVITKQVTDKSKGLFQKEAMWSIGAQYAFSQPGIEKCVFIDADCAFDDNSWAAYCSTALNNNEFVQPFVGVYYSDQPDMTHCYGKYNILLSAAYTKAHNLTSGTPGGAFACTKNFFEKVLNNHWPYSSLGSGDALFWCFLNGKKGMINCPTHYIAKTADKNGMFPEIKAGYCELIIIHYYHGHILNRMYTTRDYIVKRCSSGSVSEIKVNNDGLLEWSDSYGGKLAPIVYEKLRVKTNEYLAKGKMFGLKETKELFKTEASNVYGSIDAEHPLNIITICTKDPACSPQVVELFRQRVELFCKVPHKFIVYSTIPNEVTKADQVKEIILNRSLVSPDWLSLAIFENDIADNNLFIHPAVQLVQPFTICQCPDNIIYMPRRIGNNDNEDTKIFDARMIYYKSNIQGLYSKFISMVNSSASPEYMYSTIGDFITAFTNMTTTYQLNDLIMQLDYRYEDFSPNRREIYDFVLK